MRLLATAALLAACSDPVDTGRTTDGGTTVVRDAGGGTDAGPDAGPAVAPIPCVYLSDSHGMGPMRLDVPTGSPDRMRFTVRGVPAPDLLASALLAFDSFDADHPGEEGLIWVNDMGPFDLPADPALDEMPSSATVDVTGTTITGDNTVVFGPGTLVPGTFFEISNVELRLQVRAAACP